MDSTVTSTQRKILISDDCRDDIKVFLMTSSAARGVSFPKTDRIIALIPRFNIEAALMEIAQLIYRGRGNTYKADNGEEKSGDWKNRRLVMLLQDFLPSHDAAPDARRWLRQISDLLTYLVMLRATVYTRITGDAGLNKQQLALIPVGGIGTEEIQSLMSSAIRDFLHETDVLLQDKSSDEQLRGLCVNAQKNVTDLFSKYSLDGTATKRDFKTVARINDLREFSELASSDNALLLISSNEHPHSVLPEHRYCVGVFWLECWHDVSKQERLSFEGWRPNAVAQITSLLGQLSRLSSNDSPKILRYAAKDLHSILIRQKDDLSCEFSTVKTLKSPATWLAVPVDYPRFWNDQPLLGDESAWRDYLGACLSSRSVLPVIPPLRRYSFCLHSR